MPHGSDWDGISRIGRLNSAGFPIDLPTLARSRAPADRERLLMAIADLCDAAEPADGLSTAPVDDLLNAIFLALVLEAEHDIRRRLAERISAAAWAPSALIQILALDEIDIARPILAASPVLKDPDLVRLLVEATLEHRIEIARRPNIGPPVVAAILATEQPAVLTALAGNATAAINEHDMARLVTAAARNTAMRSALARHPALSAEPARRLYIWVGETLRRELIERFQLDAAALEAAIAASVDDAYSGGIETGAAIPHQGERQEMERRLVAKLDAAGQLRAGYLLRALKDRRLSLFAAGLACLGRFDEDEVRRALNSERPELLALACASIGIDRSVFPTILAAVRQLNGGRPGGGPEGARRASGAFGPFDPGVAGAAFRQTINCG